MTTRKDSKVSKAEPEKKPAASSAAETQAAEPVEPQSGRWSNAVREILSGSAVMSVMAIVLSIIIGGILIAATDTQVQQTAGYFFSRPGDMLKAIWDSVSGAYSSLFQGSIYNFRRPGFVNGIKPLAETLTFATPLIAAGLGVALGFRAGLFNIGGRGQMLFGAAAAGWVAFSFDLPYGLHLLIALVAGVAAGGLWGGLAGFLKARTGAHEVITTIMLNYVAFYFVYWMLSTPGMLQAPGSNNPKTPAMKDTAILPNFFGPNFQLHFGFFIVIGATFFVWWLLNRSTLGFQFRAVGFNPNAAKTAGMNVNRMYFYVMIFSGALVGLAGVFQVLGTVTTGFSSGIDAGIGFDAITVALLGRSKPWGVFAAGLLFGAFKAGGFSMQASQGIPIDIVLVVQSMIVLFIAAPPLVRAVFRLPKPNPLAAANIAKLQGKKAVVTK
ncbi:MAG: ABC transporter permease [Cryobacterium sp.]|nr:ABC transporter permease [Cryobacterium sp.]MBX3090004.1 ABC transporter permease [Cryobacterium sp.]MBX3117393.1 ABC transporter permease [Cryobacterium sp.]MCW5944212.1 ABC transporter permease [Cryobacterium sp.]